MNIHPFNLVHDTARTRGFIQKLSQALDPKRHQISLESQQLTTVGMMPTAQYRVVEASKLTIADAVKMINEAKNHVEDGSKYIIIRDEGTETVQNRVDREELTRALKDSGADVITDIEEGLVREVKARVTEHPSLPSFKVKE